jgi:putative membrane protein
MRLILTWVLAACALLLVANFLPGVHVEGFGSAMIAAAVIGLLNVLVRPVLVILTLPVTIVTLGLFLFVINALMFWAAGAILAGFHVEGFWTALFGSLIYSALMLLISAALQSLRAD